MRGETFFPLPSGFFDRANRGFGATGNLRIHLCGGLVKPHCDFLGSLAGGLEILPGIGRLLFLFITFQETFLRKLRRQITGKFFELRRQPAWQVALQSLNRGILSGAASTYGLLLNFGDSLGKFMRKFLMG